MSKVHSDYEASSALAKYPFEPVSLYPFPPRVNLNGQLIPRSSLPVLAGKEAPHFNYWLRWIHRFSPGQASEERRPLHHRVGLEA